MKLLTYDNFTGKGTYNIAVFATDYKGMISFPKQTTVTRIPDGCEWKISGTVLYNGTPLCAMVLANGQHMFSCAGDGRYELNVPLNEKYEIDLLSFCEGFKPYSHTLTPEQTENFDIIMTPDDGTNPSMTLTRQFNPAVTNTGWVKISGTVKYGTTPLCAMVLANGEHIFSCAGQGKYELEVPLNENREITIHGFCDGFKPFKKTVTP